MSTVFPNGYGQSKFQNFLPYLMPLVMILVVVVLFIRYLSMSPEERNAPTRTSTTQKLNMNGMTCICKEE